MTKDEIINKIAENIAGGGFSIIHEFVEDAVYGSDLSKWYTGDDEPDVYSEEIDLSPYYITAVNTYDEREDGSIDTLELRVTLNGETIHKFEHTHKHDDGNQNRVSTDLPY